MQVLPRWLAAIIVACVLPTCDGRDSPGLADGGVDAGVTPAPDGGEGLDTALVPPARLSDIETTIFARACSFEACHGGGSPQEALQLMGRTFTNLVNRASTQVPSRMRVVPGNPEASYLFEKITNDTPAEGVRMPVDFPLSPARIDTIRRWIAAGALDN